MKELVIIGGGGMGREIYLHALECAGHNFDFTIKGYIDDNIHSMDGFDDYPRVLSTIGEYNIKENDVFVCSIGNVEAKKCSIEKILKKNGVFISLIHPTARVAKDARIGKNAIIMRRADIGSCAKIGNYVFLQADCVIGHDAIIGDYTRVDCKVVCVGGVIVQDFVTIHTSAVISHGVTVREHAVVGALSFVMRNVKKNTTVTGNPALKLR